MGNKKKKKERQKTTFIAIEGEREEIFLSFIKEVFDKQNKIKIKQHPDLGGTSNAILDRAIKNCFYPKVYAWFDEDNLLTKDRKEILAKYWNVNIPNNIKDRDLQQCNIKNKNPILIVSNPLSVEGIIIQLFEKKFPKFKEPLLSENNIEHNKRIIKNSVDGIFNSDLTLDYYRKHLTKEYILEKSKQIKELKTIISIFDI